MPTSRSSKPSVLITMGDPSGVGPEVILKALTSPRIAPSLARVLVIGDRRVIDRARRTLGITRGIPLIDLANVSPKGFSCGVSKESFGRASIEYIDRALALLRAGKAAALVTAPVNKWAINSFFSARTTDNGRRTTVFQGHTEYLAARTRAKEYAMMFVAKGLRVSLVTRHIALKDVPGSLTVGSICGAILLTHRCLRRFFSIPRPRIGVAGLNPHAAEGGLFGGEEERLIAPAIRKASRQLKGIEGPIAPDVVFHDAINGRFDAVVAMYHDQGLIPFKMLYFSSGVNLTLGLPFIRTSPDHGTAFNIAGKGIADPASMIEAIDLACRLSKKR